MAAAADSRHFERLIVDPSSGNSLDDNDIVENQTPKTTVRTPAQRATTVRTIDLAGDERKVGEEDSGIRAKLNARGRGNLPAGGKRNQRSA